MKREFKAWYKKEQRWLGQNGDSFRIDLDGCFYPETSMGEYDFSIDCSQIELIQFTGLRDKNGRDIAEGDIIKIAIETNYGFAGTHKSIHTAIISYEGGAFWFRTLPRPDEVRIVDCCWFHYDEKDREIIGNIYENPELLK